MTPGSSRLVSLDAFRGLAMAAMVIVNNPGSWGHVYGPLRHADWHGCTPADLVFPFFLFAMGAAMGVAGPPPWPRIARRVGLLFLLGLLLNGFPRYELGSLRIMGVLQRLSLCYGIAVLAAPLPRAVKASLAAVMLAGTWAALALAPVPGGVAGDLSPGGNLAGALDRAILGRAHLYRGGSHDPEGLFTTIAAAATTILGCLAGEALRRRPGRWMALAGAALVAAGWAWSHVLPLNKQLWTGSYALFTGGLAALVLLALHLALDHGRLAIVGRPLEALGRNAILLFVGSGLFARILALVRVPREWGGSTLPSWVWRHLLAPWLGAEGGSLAYAALHLALWWSVLHVLHRRRIYLTL